MKVRVSVMGAAGYVGGELLRLLLGHPHVELVQATSNRLAGRSVTQAHPNLRGETTLTFTPHDQLGPCDLLFLATPHGDTAQRLPAVVGLAPRIIDLSADFRLRDRGDGAAEARLERTGPVRLRQVVPGFPELHRAQLRDAPYVAVPGCMANAAVLALQPVACAGLVAGEVVVQACTGSSGSGVESGPASHHAERSGVMRVFRAVGHRHEAEIRQACQVPVRMTAVAVEAVRGVQVVVHVPLASVVTDKDIWGIYRACYADEPFVRLVKKTAGLYRLPEPKILSGTNYCDIGFELSEDGRHLVVIAALDNLVKGAAGNAVQCMNIGFGWDEKDGLRFSGLHPV